MAKHYKPILVFYVLDRTRLNDAQTEQIQEFARQKGYEVLIWGGVDNERVEIISVDSATIITDLQEYIDNIVKELKNEQ